MHLYNHTKYQPPDCHPVCRSYATQDLHIESLTSGFTQGLPRIQRSPGSVNASDIATVGLASMSAFCIGYKCQKKAILDRTSDTINQGPPFILTLEKWRSR